MVSLPVLNVGVSMNEIPDCIAVTIELCNCKQKCPGCHSPWDSEKLPKSMWMRLDTLTELVKKQLKLGANAIVLMGGTNNGIDGAELAKAINELGNLADVGLYSGLEDKANIHDAIKQMTCLKWLKTGPYKKHLGGLDNPKTNQRFYERVGKEWLDRTFIFRGETNAS